MLNDKVAGQAEQIPYPDYFFAKGTTVRVSCFYKANDFHETCRNVIIFQIINRLSEAVKTCQQFLEILLRWE